MDSNKTIGVGKTVTPATQNELVNDSDGEKIQFTDVRIDFYCSMGYTFIALLIVSYVLISLIFFSWKKKYFRCAKGMMKNGFGKTRRNGAIMTGLLFGTAVTLFVYITIEVPLFWGVESPFCAHYHQTKIVCIAIGLFTLYFTLWYRVFKIFYRNPLLRQSASRKAQMLSKLTVPLLVAMTAVNAIVFLTSPFYVTTDIGCMKIQSKDGAVLKWSLLVSTTVTFQAVLLFSLIYPLYLHRKKLLGQGLEGKSIMPPIRRAAIIAGICILSDTLNALFALTNKQTIVYTRHIAYGINMMVNFLALIFSFADWKQRLFPWTMKRNLPLFSTTRNATVE